MGFAGERVLPSPDNGTAEIRDWVVFCPGYWKGDYYGPRDIERMASNYAYLKPHITPLHKLGHDKHQVLQQRLKQSLGFPNIGRVEDAGLTPDGCFVIRRLVGVPLDIAAAINAGQFNSGSVELKPSMLDPNDQSKTVKGPIFTAIALLGEEQPALPDKRLTIPKAVFANGQPVPPARDTGKLLSLMADVTKSFACAPDPEPGSFSLCFSDYSEVPLVNDKQAKLAALGLTPEQMEQIIAMFGGGQMAEATGPTPATTPAAVPSAPVTMAVGDGSKNQAAQKGAMEFYDEWKRPSKNHADGAPPADMPAQFAAFADEMKKCMSEFSQRVGAVEKFASDIKDAKESATDAAMSAELDATFEKHNGKKKLTPQQWAAKKKLLLQLAKSKEFSDAAERTKLFSEFASELQTLPVSPMIESLSTAAAAKPGPAVLGDFGRHAVSRGSVIDRKYPDVAKKYRTGATTN